ncbi:MAG: type II toxin-antitoxin system RelE/ParE family toxin [Candidatus Dadabacteria bacterium]|nr:MAG: type II toxin-antitoxin system RelE/ParE family toxin [Candidatus Dadabacteria bacterium]
MRYELVLAPQAVVDLKELRAYDRARIRDAFERYLRYEPTRVSKSRIKKLRGISRPQYRLRVGELRVYYDVTKNAVEILAIISKERAQAWLEEEGTRNS